MQMTLISFVTLCVDVHKNDAFSNCEILTFGYENRELNVMLVTYDK